MSRSLILMLKTTTLWAFLCLSAGPGRLAEAAQDGRIVIEIGSPSFKPYPLAVPDARISRNARDMGATKRAANAITQALRWDFQVAATFELLNAKSYIANPQKEGMSASRINFSDWSSVGAEGLVKVSVSVSQDKLAAEMRFFDVASRKIIHRQKFNGSSVNARQFAHTFADAVVYNLTGQRGIFRTKIAMVRKTKRGRELWVMDFDGTALRPVTKNGSINLLPSWTHDGRSLLFTSYFRHNPNVYETPVTGGRTKLISGKRGLNTGAEMSPDGSRVALTLTKDGNSEIYVMRRSGSGLKRLTKEWAIDSSPTWSPDSTRLAFVSARWGDPHIFVMNKDGSNVRRVTEKGNYNTTPDWSPKGDLIVFTARDERNVFDIFTVNPDTKQIRRLTQNQGNNEEPSFSPDGNHVVFTSTREGRSQVWVMGVDGSNQHRITREGGYSTPAWSPYLGQENS